MPSYAASIFRCWRMDDSKYLLCLCFGVEYKLGSCYGLFFLFDHNQTIFHAQHLHRHRLIIPCNNKRGCFCRCLLPRGCASAAGSRCRGILCSCPGIARITRTVVCTAGSWRITPIQVIIYKFVYATAISVLNRKINAGRNNITGSYETRTFSPSAVIYSIVAKSLEPVRSFT